MTSRSVGKRPMRKGLAIAGAFVMATGLSGCAGYDVELNGGIFDMLGVSSSALQANSKEKQVEARPGLVMPPDTTRLPPPGSAPPSAAQSASDLAAWPVGPEDRERARQAQLKAEHDAFCREAELRRRTRGRDAEPEQGPLGSCNPGLGERWFGRQSQTGSL